MNRFYSVELTKHDDPDAGVSFKITPGLDYLSPESKEELKTVLRGLILKRMGSKEDNDLSLSITHNLPGGTATVGRAYFRD